jgi:hypothetical protein
MSKYRLQSVLRVGDEQQRLAQDVAAAAASTPSFLWWRRWAFYLYA